MQYWVVLQLLWASCLTSAAVAARLLQPEGEPEIHYSYETLPAIPAPADALKANFVGGVAGQWAASEAMTAAMQARVSQDSMAAAQSQLEADSNGLTSELAVKSALRSAQNAHEMERHAEAVADSTQKIIDSIPVEAEKAAQQAMNDVVAVAFKDMNDDVKQTVLFSKGLDASAGAAAAQAAQVAALPFQQAKLRSVQTMYSYATQAQELATAVKELKLKALKIAGQAEPLQKRGNVVVAQRLRMQAHDLMDKASQMAAQAKGFSSTAASIRGELASYDLAADSAAAYAAYQANPGGPMGQFPAPPYPLELPPPPAAAPGPAPAPAPASAAPAL